MPAIARAIVVVIFALFVVCGESQAQLRVVNYNIAQLLGDEEALMEVFAALHADDKPGFAVPISVFLFQEVQNADFPILHDLLNASAPPGVLYAPGTYVNNDEDPYGGAQAMFYRAGMLLEDANQHAKIFTGAGRWTARWRLRVLGYDSPQAGFFAYSSHLKASPGSNNEDLRLFGVQQIRNNAHGLGPGRYVIYAGDFNFYHNSEPGYLWWFNPMQNNPAIDPLGTSSWAGAANAIKHTQSPRKIMEGGLVGGGMDDRFDFQLTSFKFTDGNGLSRINGTYRSFGNDGLKYDLAINDGDNFYYPDDVPRSNALADALHDASDHIPVVVDYQLPARMAANISPTNFGKVIQGGTVQINWSVINNVNTAHVVTPIGAEVLDFVATGGGALAGPGNVQSGAVAALSPPKTGSMTLDTAGAEPGPLAGTITFTSDNEAVQPPLLVRTTNGTVVGPSQPSFSPDVVITSLMIALDLDPDTGKHFIDVPVYNFGFDPQTQALLNVDGVSGVQPPLDALVDSASGIGAEPATLSFAFDTDDAYIGIHEFALTVHASDEDLPGASTSELDLTIIVGLGQPAACPEDLTGNGMVGVPDLLELLAAWGPCPPSPEECPADLTGNGTVGVPDLLELLAAWGPCPR